MPICPVNLLVLVKNLVDIPKVAALLAVSLASFSLAADAPLDILVIKFANHGAFLLEAVAACVDDCAQLTALFTPGLTILFLTKLPAK